MKVTILGCMGGYPSKEQATSSYLIQSNQYALVLDVGSGAFQNLAKIMEPTDIDAVLLTHYHHDHIADVGVLQYAYQLKPQFEGLSHKKLTIYAPHQVEEFAKLTMLNVSEGKLYLPDEVLRIGPFKITFLKTIHPVTCYAVRIEEKETKKVFVFTADSGYLADFITFAKDADLLLADSMLLDGNENHLAHMTAGEVGKIAELANVKKLVLTHLPAKFDHLILEQAKQTAGERPVFLAKVFDEYTL